MPGISAHYAVAKQVCELLSLDNSKRRDFFSGSILPDLTNQPNSHYKIRGSYYLVPNLAEFLKDHGVQDYRDLGYCAHLLLDYEFLELFIPQIVESTEWRRLFSGKEIYHDYRIVNYPVVKYFQLNLDYIERAIRQIPARELKLEKMEYNLTCLRSGPVLDNPHFLQIEPFIWFLERASYKIARQLMPLLLNLSKNIPRP